MFNRCRFFLSNISNNGIIYLFVTLWTKVYKTEQLESDGNGMQSLNRNILTMINKTWDIQLNQPNNYT